MNDRELRDALRSLPTVEPRPGFVERTVSSAEEAGNRGRLPIPGYPVRLAGAAAVLVALVAGGAWLGEPRERAEQEALRRESARLEAEIEAVRSELKRRPPVIYLGGSEEIDFVLDIGTIRPAAEDGTGSAGTRVVPGGAL